MIAHRKVIHPAADGSYHAGALVAQNQRQRILNGAVGGRQVAVTHPARGHADHHLAMLRIGHLNLFDQHCLADFARHHRLRQLRHFSRSSSARQQGVALQV